MGKISQISSKYIINATIEIEGIVERPDVIGAVFGQTEGLLGTELELRELQRSGRIGRIEVNLDTKSGKTKGTIIIPSSLDQAETSIVAAALEVIQRIGPCNAKVKVQSIEDVRISKRAYVLDRAKELLKGMVETTPDSQEMAENVSETVRVKDIVSIGKDKLPAGPDVETSEEIIIVEGRADVINLLRHGFSNAVSMNGTSVPQTIIDLCKGKNVTVFVDGDRGGDLIIRELLGVAQIDFITKAPDGKEVEELAKKEIHQALRKKAPVDQVKDQFLAEKTSLRKRNMVTRDDKREEKRDDHKRGRDDRSDRPPRGRDDRGRDERNRGRDGRSRNFDRPRGPRLSDNDKEQLRELCETIKGSKAAFILNKENEVMGKVPVDELAKTVASLKGTDARTVVMDGAIEQDLVNSADDARLRLIVGTENHAQGGRVNVITKEQLE